MQMYLMMIMILNSLLFTQMKHPMSMGMILLIQTILSALYTGVLSKTFWFSYILFLIFIGGMLILFIYMSSLSPNEKMNTQLNYFYNNTILIGFIFLMADKFFMNDQYKENSMFMNKMNLLNENLLMISKLYDSPNSFITIMMISYLLLTLIIIVKITNSFMGPLRMKN